MKKFSEWLSSKNETLGMSIIGQRVEVNSPYGRQPPRQAVILKVLPGDDTHDLGFSVKYADTDETEVVSSYYIPSVFSPPLRQMIADYLPEQM